MKKVLTLVAALVLIFGLSACDLFDSDDIDDIIDTLESVELSGLEDQTIMVDDVFDVFDGVVATGSDDIDYSEFIIASSDNCTINDDGTLVTSLQGECIIEYSVVALGKLDRLSITVTIEAEEVIVDEDAPLVKGWTFDDETALVGWTKYESGGGSVIESIDAGALKMEILSGGLVYESRFEYMGVPLQNETDYVVKFKAKSDVAGKILHFQMGELLPSDPWFVDFKPGQVVDFVLTTDFVEYSFSFTMTIDNVNGGPLFEMGNMEGSMDIDCNIWIDDLEIRGGSATDETGPEILGAADVTTYLNDVFDVNAGVTANDFFDGAVTEDIVVTGDTVDVATVGTYTVTYTVSDAAGNVSTVDRVVTVAVDDVAPVIAGIDAAVVALGSTFDVLNGVTAMDNRDGDITANIVLGGDTLDVDTAGEYSVTYTATDALGNTVTETRVIMVNAMLWDATDLITNGTFDSNPWGTWMADWNSTSATVVYNGSVVILDIADVGAENWNIQLFQEGIEIVDTKTYRVTFEAESTVDREINVKLIGTNEYVQTVAITPTMTVYTIDFTVTEDNANAKLDFELGGAQNGITVSVPSVVMFDNVMVEEFDGTAVVADTNQVLNGDFASDNLSTWSWWTADWFDPAITGAVTEEWNELVFRYSGTGDASWNHQIGVEGIVFEYGATYKLVFDAKSDLARDFQVNIWDGQMGHESGALQLLTDEFATYEFIFTYMGDADAKVEFQLGKLTDNVDGSVFYLDNVRVDKLQQDDLLVNGDFGTSGWFTWMADWNSTNATATYDAGYIELDIVDVGSENWNIQLYQEGLELVDTKTYRITFEAMSTVDREVNVKLIGATEYVQTIALTSTMTTFIVDFTVTEDNLNAKLDFELGGAQGGITVSVPSVVTIDNILFEEFDGTDVVADTNQTVNSSLDRPVDWGVWMADWNSTAATYGVANGEFVIDITDVGAENWNIQLFQEGINLVSGITYTIQFDAMTSADRDINLKMITGVEYAEMFSLTTTMTTYTFTFTYTEADGLGKIDFELGGAQNGIVVSVPSVITIDNIKVFENYNPQD